MMNRSGLVWLLADPVQHLQLICTSSPREGSSWAGPSLPTGLECSAAVWVYHQKVLEKFSQTCISHEMEVVFTKLETEVAAKDTNEYVTNELPYCVRIKLITKSELILPLRVKLC